MKPQTPRAKHQRRFNLWESQTSFSGVGRNVRPHPQERGRGKRHSHSPIESRVPLRFERGNEPGLAEYGIRAPSSGGEGWGEGGSIERRQRGRSQIRRLLFVALCFLGVWILDLGASAAAPLIGSRPNIIFILTDDQGYGDISAHGNPFLKTPNMDRLYREGVRFTDFHVSPTCAPTRSALLTGRHEFKNGVTHTIYERERLTLKATTLAEVLKSAGYRTGIFGKWHLGDEPKYWPSRRGFDEVFIHGAGGIGQTYPGSCGDAPGNTYFNPAILDNGRFVRTEGYCTDVFFAQAMKWIDSVKGKQPFLAWISPNAPHAPLQVRPEDEARYAGKVANTNAAKFFGMIANIDDNIGRLLAKLAEWGIERETLVVFMNDNGTDGGMLAGYNAGMRGKKGTPWLGGTRAASFWR